MNRMNVVQSKTPTEGLRRVHALLQVGVIGFCVSHAVESVATNPNGPGLDQVTGTAEIQSRGKGGAQLGEGETKNAFASFAAFPEGAPNGPRGEFIYSVLNPDLTLHREIVVALFEVVTDPTIGRGWMAGIVVEDTKICSGEGGSGAETGGHDEGCDDGCADTTHDDGCGGGENDTGEMPGGDSGGTTHDDGCGGDDDGTAHDDGCAGGGGGGGGDRVSGKDTRVGQLFLAKVKDLGTPGWRVDHITWKWFPLPETDAELEAKLVLFLTDSQELKLCKKTILTGNLVVH